MRRGNGFLFVKRGLFRGGFAEAAQRLLFSEDRHDFAGAAGGDRETGNADPDRPHRLPDLHAERFGVTAHDRVQRIDIPVGEHLKFRNQRGEGGLRGLGRGLALLVAEEFGGVFRLLAQEADLLRNLGEAADPLLEQRSNERPLRLELRPGDPGERQRNPGELLRGERLQIFAVHPGQLVVVEDGGRFVESVDVEDLLKLGERKEFTVILGRPAEQRDVVHDGGGEVSVRDESLETHGAVAFGEFRDVAVGVAPHDERKMDVFRDLPAESAVEQIVFRGAREVFAAAHNMGDAHGVIVDDVREVVGGHAVALDEDLIVEHFVFDGDLTVNRIAIGGDALLVDLLADDVGFSGGEVRLDDFGIEVAAAAVVTGGDRLFAVGGLRLLLLVAETVIGGAFLHEFFGVWEVKMFAFALDIGTVIAADVGAFVMGDSGGGKGFIDDVDGAVDVARLVGVLDAEDELPLLRTGEQKGVESGPEIADMHESGRARSESGSDGLIGHKDFPGLFL